MEGRWTGRPFQCPRWAGVFVLCIFEQLGCGLDVPPTPAFPQSNDAVDASVTLPMNTLDQVDSVDGSFRMEMDSSTQPTARADMFSQTSPDMMRTIDARAASDSGLNDDASSANDDDNDNDFEERADEVCRRNQFAQGGQCLDCPPGSENAPGDRPGDGDGECEPIRCGPDERVDNHRCVPCPSGSVVDVEEPLATGEDTRCDPIECRMNEKVVMHRCEPCQAWEENEAGDLATGDDTMCDGLFGGCYTPQLVLGNNAILGYEFRVIRGRAELAAGCKSDFSFTAEDVQMYEMLVAENSARNLFDANNVFEWTGRFVVQSVRVNVRVSADSGRGVMLILGNSMFSISGEASFGVESGVRNFTIRYPAPEADSVSNAGVNAPPMIQVEVDASQ